MVGRVLWEYCPIVNGIWSENKIVDLTVNILLFLTGINFMHCGQLFLPVICFILFIDYRFIFKVNQPLIFVLLCLFAVSFYAFSYQIGFYSVMAFICPMAYYIGSNIRKTDEDSVRKMIYLFAIAMGSHIFLDFFRDLFLRGMERIVHSSSHYDIWTNAKISSTAIAMELDLLIGVLYYLFVHEKSKILKYICTVLFAVGMLYCLLLARRAQLFMLFVSLLIALLFDKTISAEKKKALFTVMISAIAVLFVFVVLFVSDFLGLRTYLNHLYIFEKLSRGFMDSRLGIYVKAIPLLPRYPLGGQKISEIIGLPIHDLWLDIYDYAGIVPFILMVLYSLSYAWNIVRLYRCKEISFETKTMLFGVYICIIIQMYLEPIMTGASLFLAIAIIINGIIERMTVSAIES